MSKRLKQLFLFLSVFLLLKITSLGQQGWYQQQSGTDAMLNAVFFLDSLNGWVVGDDSTILKTSDGGEDWISLQSGYDFDFNDIYFTSDSVGWIVGNYGYGGIILYTTNSGQTWEKKSDENMRGLFSITFVNDSIGFIAGGIDYPGWGIILKTENFGENWDTSLVFSGPWDENFYDIDFVNPYVGWAVGGIFAGSGQIIIKTTDGGKNWIDQTPSANYWEYYSCDFISENEGWVASTGYDYKANLYTTDGGSSWEGQKFLDPNPFVNSIYFVDDKTGWCAFFEIYHTTDKGVSWVEQTHPIGNPAYFNSIFFIDNNLGWIVGTDGIILKTTNGGVTAIEDEGTIPTEFVLEQNYPNPFNPSTRINYSVPQTSQVQFKVFDVLGNEIETLIDEEKSIGNYEIIWNAINLPSGVYFYQLRAGDFVSTKKMILLK